MSAKIIRLPEAPPEPTLSKPYAQLEWLCERFVRRYKNQLTITTIRNTVKAYIVFLKREAGYDERLVKDPRYYLSLHCDYFVLDNVDRYWRSQNHSSHTRVGRIGALRNLFTFAASANLTPTQYFLAPPSEKLKRKTLQQEAYEEKELELIWTTLSPTIDYARRIAAGYKPTGIGSDPRRKQNRNRLTSDEKRERSKRSEVSWTWGNLVWYFENEMGCKPLLYNREAVAKHGRFFFAANRQFGSIRNVWHRLGVTPVVDFHLLIPLAMKLCWETGMNAGSLLSLKRDCLQESHPLTGLPYLRYYKERSTGEKQLLINIFDPPDHAQMPLLSKQSTIIRHTINLILQLTEPLVSKANEEDKDCLFICETPKRKENVHGARVIRLRSTLIYNYAQPLLQKLRAAGHNHVPIHLNLARFRPSRITQMVREGRDFFAIQAAAGHSSITTTFGYLSEHQIDPLARREVSSILSRIHENKEEFEHGPTPYATKDSQRGDGVIYKGIFCDCKNVYAPPQSVRRLPNYKDGQACTYFNMCLTCPNIIITKAHLPMLLNYKREIEVSVRGNNLTNIPSAAHYEKALAVLDGVLLEFDETDIRWAQEMAECSDSYIDTVTSRVTAYEN